MDLIDSASDFTPKALHIVAQALHIVAPGLFAISELPWVATPHGRKAAGTFYYVIRKGRT
ncbi:MAG: hypothetical protein JNL18_08890 [Planctomycetaceae bacterium]|uniref:Uncharacterized protein n=1 Tax=Lacipirellula limnantheis TaxID=2528024 RepID=A0A517U137_9BACT|nr:hypothetical protein [Lacipirellula limnantheis]MBL9162834.1 hypothetical protein [Planctomycetaceae bacterium]QDT74334.1 hypothetical protein I41_35290 [Lacipirellula limnantheis]